MEPVEQLTDPAAVIFGNVIHPDDYNKACKAAEANKKRFGDDSAAVYHLAASEAPVIGSRLGVRWLKLDGKNAKAARKAAKNGSSTALDIAADAAGATLAAPAEPTPVTVEGAAGKPVVIGNIRMGFGHYRIAMAMASAARAMGYTPYWFDLCAFEGTTCSKIVQNSNKLYSMGSRLSQKVGLFNSLYWEPLNSEGFRQLTYNCGDLKNAQLMTPVFQDLPKDVPFIGTHAWTAQAAVAAGLTHVVNAIPDNWPMALHLAEGSIHTIQTPGAYLGYRALRGMASEPLKPMPAGSLYNVGHYMDHELVANIPADCAARRARAAADEPLRYLVCVGGAGAQADLIEGIIEHLIPQIEAGRVALFLNVGDHKDVWDALQKKIPALADAACHFGDFADIESFCAAAQNERVEGIHAFYQEDIFGAVYSTNLLIRACDIIVTKPSELAFYPVPKLMIRRVGGHEAWGAICTAELGDGTYEVSDLPETCAMMDLLQADRSIIADMRTAIETQNSIGVYNGAYKCVELATTLALG